VLDARRTHPEKRGETWWDELFASDHSTGHFRSGLIRHPVPKGWIVATDPPLAGRADEIAV
jgi:hypothetical protein